MGWTFSPGGVLAGPYLLQESLWARGWGVGHTDSLSPSECP